MERFKIMREMRRKDKEIGTDEAIKLLTSCEYGVLSTVDNEEQPYGVPLNYAYKDNCIYFHCALTGHKINNIKDNPKVSFCVVGETKILPSEFATNYVSAIAFGVASEVQGTERYNALVWLLEKFSPEFVEEGKRHIEKKDKATKVIKIKIQHISGKKEPAK
ncbi:MAG: pyridoxamine 5'-phosphate oxidase family protein [Desulfobacteraceae bacterium]|nr:pyridoxamine 5'-phosphate oxidase family protein [Desulfobacteraceae bacterium]